MKKLQKVTTSQSVNTMENPSSINFKNKKMNKIIKTSMAKYSVQDLKFKTKKMIKNKVNVYKKSKISWTDITINPVWGCKKHCKYCYAENISKRFAKNMLKNVTLEIPKEQLLYRLRNFIPTFLPQSFNDIKIPTKPCKIFVGSMSDICDWEPEWMDKTLELIREYPNHTFQFLTKYPEVYNRYEFPKNCWLGATVDNAIQLQNVIETFGNNPNKMFVSFEPLLFDPSNSAQEIDILLSNIDWIIIGSISGGKKILRSKIEWMEYLVKIAKQEDIAVFIKQIHLDQDSKILKNVNDFPKSLQFREFPE